jgi:hypothetical protein
MFNFSSKSVRWLVVLLVLIASAQLARVTDEGLGVCWTHDVLRNWGDFGLLNLHGQLVYNPGGFEVETKPIVYPGHRAASLYPAYLCSYIFGESAGIAIYYGLLAALVFWSIWRLLGRTEESFWLAAVAVITPGYIRWQNSLDPNLAAAVFGFPYCLAVIVLIQRPVWNWRHLTGLILLILVYSAINWSTAFVHGMLFAFLLVMPGVSRRRLIAYTGIGVLVAGAVVAVSVANKLAGSAGGGMQQMLSAYGWGNEGYGLGLTTRTACLRLLAINVAGLLPVLIFLFWRFGRAGHSVRMVSGLLPLLLACLSILSLRNYAGHHPWMSCCFILLGLILSAVVLKAQLPVRPELSPAAGLVWTAAAFIYGFGMLAMGHAHIDRQMALIHFIRDHTPRSATIWVVADADPVLAGLINRLDLDRHRLVAPTGAGIVPAGTNDFVLTESPPKLSQQNFHLNNRIRDDSWLKSIPRWYARVVAHRRAGDKVEVADDYYLYKP